MKTWLLQSADPSFFVQPYHASRPGAAFDGAPFTVAGRRVKCASGYGSHAPGYVDLDLEGTGARVLRGRVAIDDEWSQQKGAATLAVVEHGSAAEVWRSPLFANGGKPLSFRVPLAGLRRIRLRWDPGPAGPDGAHVDLIDVAINHEGPRAPRAFWEAPADFGSLRVAWPFDALQKGRPVSQLALAGERPTATAPRLDLVPTFPPTDGVAGRHRPLSLYVIQANGAHTCRLVFDRLEERLLPNGDLERSVFLADPDYPVEVEQRITVYAGKNLWRLQRAIRNRGRKPVTLTWRDAGFVQLPAGKPVLRTFSGAWGREKTEFDEGPLPHGTLELSSTNTGHNSQGDYPGLFLGWDGPIAEERGRVAGAWLGRDGNWSLRAMRLGGDAVAVAGGSFPEPRQLAPGGTFETPFLLLAWSDRGLGPVTRAFQWWCLSRGGVMNPATTRRVVLNSWEGVWFTFDEEKLLQMIRNAAKLGVELFVLDDGWFGNGRYARDDDHQGLGDWQVNRKKLPHGFKPLIEECRTCGIDFGLWFEPEMVNKTSRLFEAHPDWILREDGRVPTPGRGGDQLMLDLSNPEVEEFVYHVVADVLAANPGISYVKWDHNMHGRNQGAPRLGANQGALSDLYDEAFQRIAARLRKNFPGVAFQLCASGGGRADAASMRNFEEFWGSDETRALPRIPIQWGALHFHPPCALASHVARGGAWGMKTRVDVAMAGRLGVELNPADFGERDLEDIRRGIAAYKELRPILHAAEVYRGRNPHFSKTTELTYVLPDKTQAVLLAYDTEERAHAQRIRPSGLSPRRVYEWTEANPGAVPRLAPGRATGRALMERGIRVAFPAGISTAVARLVAR